MPRTVTQNPEKPNNDDFLSALERWEGCKPPYTSSHMRICVTAAKTILKHQGQSRRSKYEKESYLRIDFSKAGKVTFYAEFPKKMGLKGRKLGEWPELAIQLAREKAVEMSGEGLRAESVHLALESYRADLEAKVQRQKLSDHSYRTYCARIKQIDLAFGEREVFGDVTYGRIIEVLDTWIATKSNNHALELFAELRRFWKYSAPQLCNGRNVAASIPDDYVSSRVQRPAPTRLFTDIESIAKLWLNVAGCTSIHQKNAMRFMILTGVRPINVSNLQWDYVREDIKEIVYPAGIIGMRGAMKTQKEFRIPITTGIERILQEQKEWRDSVPGCNQQFVFLQPRNPELPFAKRSLDKLIKTYSPENAVKGIKHDGTVKGREGAFNTMCRKFFKSNVIAQMRAKGFSRSDTREISLLCLHHSDKSADPMAEHYDFSDEILQEEMALKKTAFEAHEASILTQVILLRKKG
ncbi:recombinase [bacteria symbiont BFo2 of Frankliniella occidentalis]|nr:recombinase [bacteria symbiont BFo2 of Frankliniella occidentalis]KYP87222.1 recombinase [bacteria symbiont BFo2 of Frankliniella occidentalis]KYP95978.1 recombinase [bacteria symbiont BFo2 of Frankliniella occidentalis]